MLKGMARLNQNDFCMSIPPILDPKNRILKIAQSFLLRKISKKGNLNFSAMFIEQEQLLSFHHSKNREI